ncbi:MAG: LirA/MavJ family T4SS effector [Erythrobacter sp.]
MAATLGAMMTDYADYDTAFTALTKNHMHHVPSPQSTLIPREDHEKYIRGYAMVCNFLTDDAAFKKALKRISLKLWLAYNGDKSQSNKFTRAISVVAARHGFRVRRHDYPTVDHSTPMKFKLIGGDPQLGFFLRNKLFWKDSMDRRHGEHSHSLQWLAISAGNIGAPVAIPELYARSGEFLMKTTAGDKCSAWQWVADSFPGKRDGGATVLAGTRKDDLQTKGYRSPQNIMSYLLSRDKAGGLEKHFVASYLQAKDSGQLNRKIGADVWKQSGRSPKRYIKHNFTDRLQKEKRAALGFGNKEGDETVRTFHGVTGNLFVQKK